MDGSILHEKAHDREFRESRGDRIITRGVSVYSAQLGISGQCDVLEYRRGQEGIPLKDRDGLWMPYPVEYKRGGIQDNSSDRLQLCAQAMCLEHMLCCEIREGALYYGETRHREKVVFTEDLRARVQKLLEEMHGLYRRGYTPKAKFTKSCNACSLKDICLPKLPGKKPVFEYLSTAMEDLP